MIPEQEIPRNFNPEPYPYHHALELRIDDVSNGGLGIGRDDGWVIMVPFCLTGERVIVRIFRNHANYSEADLLEVLEPSIHRVKPRCPLFGECGGCQYQHIDYREQLSLKQQQVSVALQRIGGFSNEVNTPCASRQQYNYRSKITPHFPSRQNVGFPIGFHRFGSRRALVDIPQCPIATKEINEALPGAREAVRPSKKNKKRGGTLLLRHSLEGVTTNTKDLVTEAIGGLKLQFKAGDFFQNNPFLLPQLVDYVLAQAKGDGINYLVDSYCGVGLFSLSGAHLFNSIAGVEVNVRAVQSATENAKLNQIENCEFVLGNAEAIFNKVNFPGNETALIIDPPRGGVDEQFIQQMQAFSPARIIYVSCEPSTQARDLKQICADAQYVIDCVQPFDMFPQTRHIENVVSLQRNG